MSENNNNNANVQASGKSSSNNSLPSANRGGTGANPTPANNVGGGVGWGDGGLFSGGGTGRRRSSANEGKFSGLNQLKRNSQDGGVDAKKASFMEQKPGSGGVLSNMWNKYVSIPLEQHQG
ncbi:MAG: hypothetical protein Q9160_007788 [Pyrenula sp. 1 TL-2023]